MRTEATPSGGLNQRLSTVVACVSLGVDAALTLDPRRSAAALGWTDREGVSRLVGIADLVPAAGLLLGRRRARWMLVRALLNASTCLVYARVLAAGGSRRAGAGPATMAALTVLGLSLSRPLREAETP